ncbi:unnamed protein product, partial [Brenthis ino]
MLCRPNVAWDTEKGEREKGLSGRLVNITQEHVIGLLAAVGESGSGVTHRGVSRRRAVTRQPFRFAPRRRAFTLLASYGKNHNDNENQLCNSFHQLRIFIG